MDTSSSTLVSHNVLDLTLDSDDEDQKPIVKQEKRKAAEAFGDENDETENVRPLQKKAKPSSQSEIDDDDDTRSTLEYELHGYVKSRDFWFEDGSIVLLAKTESGYCDLAYRVHSSYLSRRSTFFRNLFEAAKPVAKDGTVKGCPVIRVQDKTTELDGLFRALYDGTVFETQDPSSMKDALNVFPLADKYDMPDLRRRSLSCLSIAFPTTLADFDTLLARRGAEKKLKDHSPYPYMHFGMVISAAVRTGASYLLPAAYYLAIRQTRTTIVRAWGRDAEDRSSLHKHLSRSDFLRLLRARELLTQRTMTFVTELLLRSYPCSQYQTSCKEIISRIVLRLQNLHCNSPLPLHFALEVATAVRGGNNTCGLCHKEVARLVETFRRETWEKLPEMLELQDWETLRKAAKRDLEQPPPAEAESPVNSQLTDA